MTMLDRMRRHRNWLKFSLGAVVLAFVVLYIPSFLSPQGAGNSPADTVVEVSGRRVLVGTYMRAYQTQLASLRSAYGSDFDDNLIRQLGLRERILQQLVSEQIMLAEADRLGVGVTDAELRERIMRLPALQENGQFIGSARYEQFLSYQRPPMRRDEFESALRDQMTVEKLQAAIAGWLTVTDEEVEAEYRRRNEKVKLDLAVFTAAQFRSGIQPTDAELQAHFDANRETYRVSEKRRVRYLSISPDILRATMTVTPGEVTARYQESIATYSTPEQIRASHILFKTEGKDDAAVKAQAEAVLAKVRAGGDFAALAKQYSEDDVSKVDGGDLDYFGRGRMVKPFEDAAFAMNVGDVSDLVKSDFGYHIIKVTDKKAASTKTLDEVRPQIEDQLKYEKASVEAARVADELAREIKTPADLDRVARARSMAVGDSGLFGRDEPLVGLGFAPNVAAQAFTMTVDQVSPQLPVNQGGYAFIALAEVKPSYLPALDEAKDRVREDVIRVKAVEVARTRAAQMARTARGNFAAAAKNAGVEVKTTDLITRGSALPEIGVNGAVDDAVFGLATGDVAGPITTESAVVVARVAEREDVSPDRYAAARDTAKASLLSERREQFFSAYMAKIQRNIQPDYNDAALRTLLGG